LTVFCFVVLFNSVPDTTMNLGWETRLFTQHADFQVMIGYVWYNRTHNKVNNTWYTVFLSTLHCSNITCTFHVLHRKLTLKKGTTMKLVVPCNTLHALLQFRLTNSKVILPNLDLAPLYPPALIASAMAAFSSSVASVHCTYG
jgi:hypothetical protein